MSTKLTWKFVTLCVTKEPRSETRIFPTSQLEGWLTFDFIDILDRRKDFSDEIVDFHVLFGAERNVNRVAINDGKVLPAEIPYEGRAG